MCDVLQVPRTTAMSTFVLFKDMNFTKQMMAKCERNWDVSQLSRTTSVELQSLIYWNWLQAVNRADTSLLYLLSMFLAVIYPDMFVKLFKRLHWLLVAAFPSEHEVPLKGRSCQFYIALHLRCVLTRISLEVSHIALAFGFPRHYPDLEPSCFPCLIFHLECNWHLWHLILSLFYTCKATIMIMIIYLRSLYSTISASTESKGYLDTSFFKKSKNIYKSTKIAN